MDRVQMKFPIKYIENNLVFNVYDECYAYYEVISRNYSYLTEDEKYRIHYDLCDLLEQNGSSDIHMLQIGTQSSIRAKHERLKKVVTGNLRKIALAEIDAQTEAIIDIVGQDTETEYRYYIGFKLVSVEEELKIENVKKQVKNFFRSFNSEVMGDYFVMNDDEIQKYSRLEKFMHSRISELCNLRPVTVTDLGYIVEHLYGRVRDTYDEYTFEPYSEKIDSKTIIKLYDYLSLTNAKMTEKDRQLRIETETGTMYCACFTIDSIVGDLPFPGSELLYRQQEQFEFPIDVSMHIKGIKNKDALSKVRDQKTALKDIEKHADESDMDVPQNVSEAVISINELEGDLEITKESLYKLSYVVRVSASSAEELITRCDTVRNYYEQYKIRLIRPYGNQLGLHCEFIPSNVQYINDYVRRVKAEFIASLGFGTTNYLGDSYGIYIGHTHGKNPKNVYYLPWLAAQKSAGNAVTNSLSVAFTGATGFGKSVAGNLLLYWAALCGAKEVILDPKSERGKWKEKLPHIAHEIDIINITSDKENAGMLDPYVIMQTTSAAEEAAVDVLAYLTGVSLRDDEKWPLLQDAVSAVSKRQDKGLIFVIDELNKIGTEASMKLAKHIKSFTKYGFAKLLFGDGTKNNTITFEKQISVIQIADLVLPSDETDPKDYSASEVLSIAMLMTISTFLLSFIKRPSSEFKIVDIDEAWAILKVAKGKELSDKMVRAGRSMNAASWFQTQQANDIDSENMKNNLGAKFVFHANNTVSAKSSLALLGLDEKDEGLQEVVKTLKKKGDCLMADIHGRVGRIWIHPVFAWLLDAFDTTPKMESMGEDD